MATATNFLYDPGYLLTPCDTATLERMADLDYREFKSIGERYAPVASIDPRNHGVAVWVSTTNSVLDEIESLRDTGIDARPLYLFGFAGHWSLEPGEDPGVATLDGSMSANSLNAAIGATPSGHRSNTVGIVDGGFGNPDSVEDLQQITNPGFASTIHGTFVRSIIRLLAPKASLLISSIPLLANPTASGSGVATGGIRCSDDLAVAETIRTLGLVEFLNLSLGTYVGVVGGQRVYPPATSRQIARAVRAGTVVVAAGGNSILERAAWIGTSERSLFSPAFFPACHEMVIAVGACDRNGTARKWNHDGDPVAAYDPWWNVTAPGVHIVGAPSVTAGAHDYAARWSGSSFAAPCVTGLMAAGVLYPDPVPLLMRRVASAQTAPVINYDDAPGLLFEEAGVVIRTPATP